VELAEGIINIAPFHAPKSINRCEPPLPGKATVSHTLRDPGIGDSYSQEVPLQMKAAFTSESQFGGKLCNVSRTS
jgi:hypothetical protein